MHHYVSEIHEDPIRGRDPFEAQREDSPARQDLIDMVRDRFDLTIRVARAQHEVIGDGGELRDVEDEDVFGLFFEGRLSDSDRFGLRLRYDRSPPDTT
jgi:hypothetical protein